MRRTLIGSTVLLVAALALTGCAAASSGGGDAGAPAPVEGGQAPGVAGDESGGGSTGDGSTASDRQVVISGDVTITAEDAGAEALLAVEDDGVGSDPEVVRAALSGESSADSVGLGNVDARLRQVYGDAHGLVVETAPGAGTRVSFRVPKYSPGVTTR